MSLLETKQLKEIWAAVPPDYYFKLNILQKLWHEWKWLVIKHLVSGRGEQTKKILDIGCSSGHLLGQVEQLYPKAKIHGVDVHKPALCEAIKRFPRILFKCADAHKLPFKNDLFDLVLCSDTIEHVVEPKKVLSEINRVLKPNGKALIAMDSGSLLFRCVWYLWINFGRGKVWKDAHLHPFKASELEQLIYSNGFTIKQKILSHFGMAVSFLVVK